MARIQTTTATTAETISSSSTTTTVCQGMLTERDSVSNNQSRSVRNEIIHRGEEILI